MAKKATPKTKSSRAKSTSSRSAAKPKKAPQPPRRVRSDAELARDKDIAGIVIIAVAAIMLISFIMAPKPDQADVGALGLVSLFIVKALRFIGGGMAIALPIALLVYGVVTVADKNSYGPGRLIGLILLILALFGLGHLSVGLAPFKEYMKTAAQGVGGGAVGALLDACSKPAGEYNTAPHVLPAPLETACYANGTLVEPSAARKLRGFRLDPDWTPSDGAGTRKNFVHVPVLACDNGGSLVFEFDGTAVGLYCVCGPNAGVLSYSVDGRAYPLLDTYTAWSRSLHIPWLYMLADGLDSGHHVLKLKIVRGKGSGCYIKSFAVNK